MAINVNVAMAIICLQIIVFNVQFRIVYYVQARVAFNVRKDIRINLGCVFRFVAKDSLGIQI